MASILENTNEVQCLDELTLNSFQYLEKKNKVSCWDESARTQTNQLYHNLNNNSFFLFLLSMPQLLQGK